MRVTGCMHGEYKMPGGKLIVVDLRVEDRKIAHTQVSGDFFLEPDAALNIINAALDGQPADADMPTLAGEVERRLGPDVKLYGISPEAVAIAVRRALDQPS